MKDDQKLYFNFHITNRLQAMTSPHTPRSFICSYVPVLCRDRFPENLDSLNHLENR